MNDGFGAPWPWRDVSLRRPVIVRLVYVVIELSCVCITSAMIVRSDQCRRSYSLAMLPFCRHSSFSQVRQRGVGRLPSVSTVCSSDIAFEPLPYRTGSTCVCSSGWNDDVIATPWL